MVTSWSRGVVPCFWNLNRSEVGCLGPNSKRFHDFTKPSLYQGIRPKVSLGERFPTSLSSTLLCVALEDLSSQGIPSRNRWLGMLVEAVISCLSRDRLADRLALVLRLRRSIRVVNTRAMMGMQKRRTPQVINKAINARSETSEQWLLICADFKSALLIRGAKKSSNQTEFQGISRQSKCSLCFRNMPNDLNSIPHEASSLKIYVRLVAFFGANTSRILAFEKSREPSW